jgi:nitroreductase
MQASHAIRERRSVRAFEPQPLPAKLMQKILDLCRWAPSWADAQAWNVFVVTGEPLERLKATFSEKAASGAFGATDLPMPPRAWPDYLARRIAMGDPPPEATQGSATPTASGASVWEFYGAPCLLLFAIDEQLEPRYACLDTGALVQTICLAAEDRGLATCIMAMAVRFPEVLHELIPAAEKMRFVVGIAMGQADHSAPANRSERQRIEVDEFVHWIE